MLVSSVTGRESMIELRLCSITEQAETTSQLSHNSCLRPEAAVLNILQIGWGPAVGLSFFQFRRAAECSIRILLASGALVGGAERLLNLGVVGIKLRCPRQ